MMTGASDRPPQVVQIVILDEGEALMAAIAIRTYLADIRAAYRRNVKRNQTAYAELAVAKFDRYLDLYERLGSDPDEVLDIHDEPMPHRTFKGR